MVGLTPKSELVRRIEEARERNTTYKSARQLSMAATGDPDYLSTMNSKQTKKPSAAVMANLANCLDETVYWLLTGKRQAEDTKIIVLNDQFYEVIDEDTISPLGDDDVEFEMAPRSVVEPIKRDATLPIMGGAVGGFDAVFADNGNALGYTWRPQSLEGVRHAYAVYMTGESMEPRYYAGELLQVDPTKPVKSGDFVVIQTIDEEGSRGYFVKQYRRKTAGAVICEQFNPQQEVEYDASHVVAAHKIVGTAAER